MDMLPTECPCMLGGIIVGVGVLLYFIRQYFQGARCTSNVRLEGKTVLITGANTGIGYETAKDMAARGARVILACRSMEKAETAADYIRKETKNGNVVTAHLDLSDLASVRKFSSQINNDEERLDILINNAGLMVCPKDWRTKDGFEMQIGVNHLGHFLLTNLLLDKIKASKGARIVTVSSIAPQFQCKLDLNDINAVEGYSGWEIYGRSKLANIMFTYHLNKLLQGSDVTCYSLHPGAVRTELQRHSLLLTAFLYCGVGKFFFKTAKQGAQTTIHCAVQEGIEKSSGKYFSECREADPVLPMAYDDSDCEKLWAISAKLVNLM